MKIIKWVQQKKHTWMQLTNKAVFDLDRAFEFIIKILNELPIMPNMTHASRL